MAFIIPPSPIDAPFGSYNWADWYEKVRRAINEAANGTIAVDHGGTGFISYTVGDILAANTSSSFAKIADVATGNALISGGVSTLPLWGKIGLTTHVNGILPVANGGTATATPSLVSSNGITISGTWPNQTATLSGPSFRAQTNSGTSLTTTVFAKVTLDNEIWDTANCFASSRFTPNVAGYYRVSGTVYIQTTGTLTAIGSMIYKNGASYSLGAFVAPASGAAGCTTVTDLVSMNGTTDYVELWARGDGSGTISVIGAQPHLVIFSAEYIRPL